MLKFWETGCEIYACVYVCVRAPLRFPACDFVCFLTSVISVHLHWPIYNIAWTNEQNTGGFRSLTQAENHALVPSKLISLPLLFFVCWAKLIHQQRGQMRWGCKLIGCVYDKWTLANPDIREQAIKSIHTLHLTVCVRQLCVSLAAH